jgi:hypothetical protein
MIDENSSVTRVMSLLNISEDQSRRLILDAQRLYIGKMNERFSNLRIKERLKRTNPFLLRIRGIRTVVAWAESQIQGVLFASEEEAVGHLLEAIAKICHPGACEPEFPDDLDYEVTENTTTSGYQVKMSWDCMPMSSRKNLSSTIRILRGVYEAKQKNFVGYFAPCYGKAKTSKQPGQEYVSLASREFWTRVGGGDPEYDVKVGEVCAILCSDFRSTIQATLIPDLVHRLTEAALPLIGEANGDLDYAKLFRRVNP